MTEFSWFSRLEPRPRDNDLNSSLAAKIRDPLWFLTRQWQLGKFQAEDAGSLAFIDYAGSRSGLPRWLKQGVETPIDQAAPLEAQTLREAFEPDLSLRVELAQDFGDFLVTHAGSSAAVLIQAFHTSGQFELTLPTDSDLDPLDAATRRFLLVCAGRSLDGFTLYQLGLAIAAGGNVPSAVTTDPNAIAQIKAALADLVSRVALVFGEVGSTDPSVGRSDPVTWQPGRLEYRLQVIAADPSGAGNATLDAHPDSDGEFDWFSFEVASKNATASEAAPVPVQFSMIPGRVEFAGMPSPHFWNFEENTLAIPDLKAEVDDLIKIMVADFMVVHSNDWYVLPYLQPVGTLAKTDRIVVHDVFGKLTLVERADAGSTAPGTNRWTMFSITDRSLATEGLSNYFVLPPTSGAAMHLGSVLEDVRFGRDEMANMAWGIERVTLSPIGEQRSGRERAAEIDARTNLPAPAPTDNGYPLRYQMESAVPANWFPLFAIQPAPPNPSIQLERGEVLRATSGGLSAVPSLSAILNPSTLAGQDYRIEEEEVPRAGLRVARVVYRARWVDGSTHLWTQRRRSVGAGESQSGLQFDQALPKDK
ncbi:MAG TPA: hypothetical protein VFK05_24615 [Polyangiaceae bacterium]|nr:hypothetical protein [Polyangiaceae bacterium]